MIDTDALRKKVIDLAIQGKLTEQLPSDGDAETLYVQIQEEMARLIKEGQKKARYVLGVAKEELDNKAKEFETEGMEDIAQEFRVRSNKISNALKND